MAGRMCIHLFNKSFGDINEEYCALFGQYSELDDKVNNLDLLENDFRLNNDFDVYNFLDNKLYTLNEGDERTYEQIIEDSKPFWKFDFMTNSGESFDNSKSFIYGQK